MAAITTFPLITPYRRPGKHWIAGFHTGIDFLTPTGSPLVAPVDSTIIHAGTTGGWGSAYGVHVIGEATVNGTRYRWMTAHMTRPDVKAGQRVRAGARLGTSGNTGNTTGPHVHFEVRRGKFGYHDHVNPAVILDASGYRPSGRRWLKVCLVNHAAATGALARLGAAARWLTRRRKLFDLVADVNADVIGGLECGAKGTWSHIQKAYRNRGYELAHNVKGRALWLKQGNQPIAKGTIDPPRRTPDTAGSKPAPWIVARFDGTPALIVLAHLETHDDSNQLRVRQMAHIITEAEKVATAHDLGKSQIIYLADTASNEWVREYALAAAGYRDAFDVARKAVNGHLKSYNQFKAPVTGPRVDLIGVYHGKGPGRGRDHARPVRVISQRPTKLTDHHPMQAVIERQ
ncbi:peptidoglycan DD-metalloendopeptidase family protein [Mycolicibacterium sp.]|uniref:peptidoglycan DD-metalloendopeptidase family protein n=1 Tax=Mycolicibacterium sp. TaxID=2320850 RepID=UPI00355D33BA